MELIFYMSKQQMFLCSIVTIAMSVICTWYITSNIYYSYGKEVRDSIINIKYENINTEIYQSLKAVGVTLSNEQKANFEKLVKQKHNKVGFAKEGA